MTDRATANETESVSGARILLVDDTPTNLSLLVNTLDGEDYDVLVATSGEQAIKRCEHEVPDLVLLDVMMPGMDGYATFEKLKELPVCSEVPVIFMTALSEADNKVRAFEAGAVDYITKPINPREVAARVKTHLKLRHLRARLAKAKERLEEKVELRTRELREALSEVERLKVELEEENSRLRDELGQQSNYDNLIGAAPVMMRLQEQIEMVAGTEANVLILGESGTGKELVARQIHQNSSRADEPLITVNCASVPTELFESHFFGHVKGAFTGANKDRAGLFEVASDGTLFLDEVGEIPQELQGKFLRVLQEGTFQRVGSVKQSQTNARIVAATNRDLAEEVQAGRFREDLFYRLNVFPIQVPPLRDRKVDIEPLTRLFLERAAKRLGLKEIPDLSEEHLEKLRAYDWPGNVRELENVVARAAIMSRTGSDLVFDGLGSSITSSRIPDDTSGMRVRTEDEIQELIRANMKAALEQANWKVRGDDGAAQLLGLKPTTLYSRMKRYDIERPDS